MEQSNFWSAMGLYIAFGLIAIGIVQFIISVITTRWRSAKQVKQFPGPETHWLKGNINDVSTNYSYVCCYLCVL